MIAQPLCQAAAIEFVQRQPVANLPPVGDPPAEDVAETHAAQGCQLAIAAHIGHDPIIDSLGGLTLQVRVVQRAEARQRSDVHLDQPAVDHVIAGDVPQERIASLTAGMVAQPHVQQFMSHHEAAFVIAQAGIWIHIDFAHFGIDRGNRDAHATTQRRVLDDFECRRQRAKQRITADEPGPRQLRDGSRASIIVQRFLLSGGHVHRARYGQRQACCQITLPIGFLLFGKALGNAEHIEADSTAHTEPGGFKRYPMLTKLPVQPLLMLCRDVDPVFEFLRRTTQFQVGQEASNEQIAGDVPGQRIVVRLEVSEAQVQEAVRQHVGPLLRFSVASRVSVNGSSAGHNRPAIRRAQVAVAPDHLRMDQQR